MDSRKAAWIWTGLVLTAGVGLVLAASTSTAAPSSPLPSGQPSPQPLPPPPQGPRVPAGSRVLLVGDSLAVGLTSPLKQLVTGSGSALQTQAKEGTTVLAWASRDYPACDVAVVSLGTNDMKMLDPLAERPKVDQLLATLRSRASRVVWVLPPPMPFPDRGVLGMIRDAAAKAGVEVLVSPDVPRSPDKIHPTAAGYAGWAGLIWRAIN